MKLLLTAATEGEIMPLIHYLQQYQQFNMPLLYKKHSKEIQICITGVGQVATAYAVTKALQSTKYDLALQAGVGGSFDKNIALGDLVFITSERYGDMGAEDHEKYIDVFDMGLMAGDKAPYINNNLVTPLLPIHEKIQLQRVSGLTVNTVSGNETTIQRRAEAYQSQVESMEGAAFHYVCLNEQVPFAQIRGISNYVEPRDKSKWKMKDAIIALNKWLINFLETV
ncbi:MAG TPA: futalosine hydrolase [Flavipsychrobacter sp.]|nr:futalosine hydrolase [Flavipsychrobacter sp.]